MRREDEEAYGSEQAPWCDGSFSPVWAGLEPGGSVTAVGGDL